jgi:6-phosphofructokinase 1
MDRIAVLTSGGDAPGMNAAIRAVVRTALDRGVDVFGVRNGYEGLIEGKLTPMGARDVGGIIQRGGTILGSARSLEFKTEKGRVRAIRTLNQYSIQGLVVIGGNGSQTGAYMLSEMGFPVVGVASTIDNDLYGSEITIGVDTALNIALEAIDRLKITASSHSRAFLLEVMGRDSGYLALMAGIAGGAEMVVVPEVETTPEAVAKNIQEAYEEGKAHAIVVVAEGAKYNVKRLEEYFTEHKDRLGFDIRVAILGHIQRGGNPGAFDRILASRLGAHAVRQLLESDAGVLMGLIKSQIVPTPLSEVVSNKKGLDMRMVELAGILD